MLSYRYRYSCDGLSVPVSTGFLLDTRGLPEGLVDTAWPPKHYWVLVASLAQSQTRIPEAGL